MEGDRPLCGAEAGEPVLHPPASGKEERREGRRVDSDVHPQRPGARQLCPGGTHPAAAPVRQAHLRPQRRHRPQADQAGRRAPAVQHPPEQLCVHHGLQELRRRGGRDSPRGDIPGRAPEVRPRQDRQQARGRRDPLRADGRHHTC